MVQLLVSVCEFSNLRHEIAWDCHDGLGGINIRFILRHCLIFGLLVVVGEHAPYSVLIPSSWKIVLVHCCFFFLRLRYANKGLPLRS